MLPALLAACLLAGPSVAAAAENLYREAKELRARYAEDLEKLAAWCEQEGLAAEAKQTRAAQGPHDPYKLYVPVLPRRAGPPKLPAGAVPVLIQWNERFTKLRQEQAAALYALAQRAMHRHQASLAYALVLEAIGADPDHEAARRLLGYQKYEGLWRTAFEIKKLRAGQVWDEKFGWLPEAQVARYRQGQRFVGDRWITAEEDARRHRDIHSPWRVETEHYAIRTDHSLEAAVGLGVKLENLYRIWEQIYIRFYANEAYVAGLFSGHPTGLAAQTPRIAPLQRGLLPRPRRVTTGRSAGRCPGPTLPLGVYLYDREATAYFFAGKESDDRTLYHEATHQLFNQSRRVSPELGSKGNFWIVEGAALYMESLREEDGYFVLGGLEDTRVNAARYHLMTKDFYVPFAQLVGYGQDRFQHDPKIKSLYSQAAGMTSFLIHAEGGRYRDALVAYLVAVYTGQDAPDTLSNLTGCSYAELDQQYRRFMRVDKQSAMVYAPLSRRERGDSQHHGA